jgi:hypothetical protein
MFREKTAFVIGAGAGVEIGMPTGATLIDEISKRVSVSFEGSQLKTGAIEVVEALRIAAKREEIDRNKLFAAGRSISTGARQMRSIDSYIHAHSHDEAIKICGKIAIVDTILRYEKRCAVFIDTTKHPLKFRDPQKAADSWLDEFMHLVTRGVVLEKNLDEIFDNVAVINFNYDRCFEQFVCKSLMDTFGIPVESAGGLISRKLTLHHPYGKIGPLPWQTDKNDGVPLGGDPYGEQDDIARYAKNIRTFNEEVEKSAELEVIQQFFVDAKRVIFLGFHFHPQNVDLITPVSSHTKGGVKRAYVSTYGRKAPELEIVQHQIEHMFHTSAHQTGVHLDVKLCRELLDSYGTTLVS